MAALWKSFGTIVLFFLQIAIINGETTEEWRNMAKEELERALNIKQNHNVAKNVILFIGDGLGISTITASRVYKAQSEGQKGKQPSLVFEKFPHVGLAKTYSNDRMTGASASAATALMNGVKINEGTVGVGPEVERKDCEASKADSAKITSIVKWSIDEGKSAGLVTTSRVTHATPSSAYAHSADRNWEGVTEVVSGCKDIAAQMVDNMDLNVVFGGGRRYFLLSNQTDPRTSMKDAKQRTDNRDLTKEWKNKFTSKNKKAEVVYNKGEFEGIDPAKTDAALGLFAPSHMAYDAERDVTAQGEPSLAEMTRKAIQILKKNDKGFFLMVEGARIDHAHHNNSGKRALTDTIAMTAAVEAAVAETAEKDTLIVVTADHSHVFNIAGYPSREVDILGFVDTATDEEYMAYDKNPYTTLVYGNGPGPDRTNLTGVDTAHIDFQQPVAVRMKDETHAGEDVSIYARGPMSHLFHGVHEQHYIAHVMAYASCVGENKNHCHGKSPDPCGINSSATTTSSFILSICTLFLFVL